MARVLLILSIVFVLAAAGLGFMAKQKVDLLQNNLSSTKQSLSTAQTSLKSAEKKLADTQTELDQTKQSLEESQTAEAKAKSDLTAAQTELASAKAETDATKGKLDKINSTMQTLMEKFKGIDPENIGKTLEDLAADKGRLETELQEQQAIVQTLNEKIAPLEENLAKSTAKVNEYKQNAVRPGLSGKVLAYNPGWNFVVLSIGDNAGLKSGVNMVIARGGSVVGKVRVTSVEPNSAIADVLPGTLARGAQIQPGDTVMFQGNR